MTITCPPYLHCRRRKPNQRRGLCYNHKPIRVQYASGTTARDGLGARVNNPTLAKTPTRALPGTEEKVRVLEQRARENQLLFHPLDAAWRD